MDIGEQVGRILDGTNKRYGNDVEAFLESSVKVLGSRVDFVICFIGNNNSQNAKEVSIAAPLPLPRPCSHGRSTPCACFTHTLSHHPT